MGILNIINRLRNGEPSKFIYNIFKTKSGKRKKKYLLRERNKSDKTYLQKQHFGTFSPLKRFR